MDGFSPHIRLKGNHMKINKEKLRKTVFAGINKTWEFTLMIVKKTLFLLVEEAAKIQTKIDRGLQMRKDTKYGIWYLGQNAYYSFPILNSERDNNYFELFDCKIPFLNGGSLKVIAS